MRFSLRRKSNICGAFLMMQLPVRDYEKESVIWLPRNLKLLSVLVEDPSTYSGAWRLVMRKVGMGVLDGCCYSIDRKPLCYTLFLPV